MKKAHFKKKKLQHLRDLSKTAFNGSKHLWGSPEPPDVSGGAPCRTHMDCSERVNSLQSLHSDVCSGYQKINMSRCLILR